MKFLRIDDIGASTKEFNIYGRNTIEIGKKTISFPQFISNFLFFKRLPFITGWGKYKELNYEDWIDIINTLKDHNAKLNIAITACWVEKDGSLTKFNNKFPEQTEIIKYGVNENIFYILNHGLTHCIPGKHVPFRFKSVQKYHREFTNFLPLEKQYMHIRESQLILEEIFGEKPKILVPPGNMFNEDTLISMQKLNIRIIQCERNQSHQPNNEIIKKYEIKHIANSKNIEVIHDKDIVKDRNFLKKFIANKCLNNSESLEHFIC